MTISNFHHLGFSLHFSFLLFLLYSNIIEHGTSRPPSFTSFSFGDENDSLDDLRLVALETPDEGKRVEEFEERLRYALEQSLLLQMKQMNQIDNLEQDLKVSCKHSVSMVSICNVA